MNTDKLIEQLTSKQLTSKQLTSKQQAIEAINKIALAFGIDVDLYEEV